MSNFTTNKEPCFVDLFKWSFIGTFVDPILTKLTNRRTESHLDLAHKVLRGRQVHRIIILWFRFIRLSYL